jgi:hypothetical protein
VVEGPLDGERGVGRLRVHAGKPIQLFGPLVSRRGPIGEAEVEPGVRGVRLGGLTRPLEQVAAYCAMGSSIPYLRWPS